jgi:RHS repeat-associated protein
VTDTYAYDEASQLLSITPSTGPTRTFTYDDAGRRLTDTVGSEVTTSTSDVWGRLAEVEHTGTTPWSQTRRYDPSGTLSGVTTTDAAGTATVALDWDPTMVAPALLGIAGDSTEVLVGGPVGADLRLRGAEVDGLAIDPLGTLLATPATDDLVAHDAYGAFGAPMVDPGPAPTLGFRGELLLGGLVHLRARDLDPTTATFTTRDPLDGFAGTTTVANPYHYADNDPVGRADPLGLYAIGDGAFDDGDLLIPISRIDGAPCLPPIDRDGDLLVYNADEKHCVAWFGDCGGALVAWVCENSDFLISGIAALAGGFMCSAAALPAGPAAAGAAGSTCGGAIYRGLQAYANGQDPWAAALDLRAVIFDAAAGATLGAIGGRLTRPATGAAGGVDDAGRAGTSIADDIVQGALPRGGVTLTQDGLEHIVLRHWATSGAARAGKFGPGTSARNLRDMIDDAVRGGASRPNTNGRPGMIFEYDFGRLIGKSISGRASTRLRVIVAPNGHVITAFPY